MFCLLSFKMWFSFFSQHTQKFTVKKKITTSSAHHDIDEVDCGRDEETPSVAPGMGDEDVCVSDLVEGRSGGEREKWDNT